MTAVIQIEDKYTEQFQEFVETLPKKAVKLTVIKNNLDEEIIKRVSEIQNNKILTKPLGELSWLRDRYVQH